MNINFRIVCSWLDSEFRIFSSQLYDDLVIVESFAEYVPAPCTHRPSSQPNGVLVKFALSNLNQSSVRRAKS